MVVSRLPSHAPARLQEMHDPMDVLERAAVLEFCEGLPRKRADAQALAEAGFASWEGLALALRTKRQETASFRGLLKRSSVYLSDS